MAIQISIHYHNMPVTYDVTIQEDAIYHLRYRGENNKPNGEYIPQKIVIRKKGKIWISDAENYQELVSALTNEICSFITHHNSAA